MMNKLLALSLVATVASLMSLAGTASAADWGDLTGRFVYDGAAPAPAPLVITKDIGFCTRKEFKDKLVDETVVVGKDGGIQYVAVLLYLRPGDDLPPIHESYSKPAEAVELDNKGCRFVPHTVAVRTGQTLLLKNTDAVSHNTKVDSINNPPLNPLLPAGAEIEHKFELGESIPVPVSCSIHPWMRANVYVNEHPYVAITDADGRFTIKNLPVGTWTFRMRHDTGYVQEVKRDGKPETWSKGRVELKIEKGVNDLGEILFAPKP